jgi:hypothetical protein
LKLDDVRVGSVVVAQEDQVALGGQGTGEVEQRVLE